MPQTKERRREIYQERREEILTKQRQYLADNPEKAKEYNRRSYWGNPEARRESRKAYYAENRDAELQRNREYHDMNQESIAEQRHEYYEQNKNSIIDAVTENREKNKFSLQYVKQRMLSRTKYRAKRLGIPFNLTLDDIVIPDVCPVFGRPFDLESINGVPNPWTPSIDKVIPSLGYVKGNIQIISLRANILKGNASLEELRMLVAFLEKINK